MTKFRLTQVAFAAVIGIVITSGSVASWSISGGAPSDTISEVSQNTPSTESAAEGSNSSDSAAEVTSSSDLAVTPDSISESEFFEGQTTVTQSSASPSSASQPLRQSSTPPTNDDRLANLVLDPKAGGSPEVVYPHPSDREQTVSTKAPAPKDFRVTAIGDDFVSLAFTTSPSVSLYQVYVRYEDSYSQMGVGSNGVATFKDLAPDFDYVACVFYQAQGVDSNLACLDIHTTGTRPVEPVRAPAPTNIKLSATETTVTASWDAVPGAKWYMLCHVSEGSSWQCGGYTNLGPTSAIFQDGSISKATRYGITIEAVMEDGNNGLRAISYITTPGTLPPPPVRQAAASNLRITAISPTEFTAAWDYPADSTVTLWSIAVRQLTSYSQSGVSGSGRSFTYRDLQPSNGYEIILKGIDSNGVWTEEARLGFWSPAN
jgi:hypothetical protein